MTARVPPPVPPSGQIPGLSLVKAPPGPAWRGWNTLQTLWAGVYLIWGLDALLLFTAIIGAQVHRDAMQSIGRDSAPSIIAAQSIKSAMADMDANAANELLAEPGKVPEAVREFEARRQEAAKALIAAAKNITYGEEEQRPIETIQLNLGNYEMLVQRARDLHERRGADYIAAYREAAEVMDKKLLPAADDLDAANAGHLKEAYAKVSNKSAGSVFLLLIAGAFLLWALISVQKFLTRRMHRILNPMLVFSTLITLGFILYTFATLGSERHRLTVAKEDAFDSIGALWRARAEAYAANADESRYLLDSAHADDYEKDFFDRAARLAKLPAGMTFEEAAAAVRDHRKVPGFTGYLGKEANNITFEGEESTAASTLETLARYLAIDKDIRSLEQSHKHAEAIELCIGTNESQSNWAFEQFDRALKGTLAINQQEFNEAVEQGFDALSYYELKASIIALVIALLAFGGLLQRIREYR